MSRDIIFGFRVNTEEKLLISVLAERLQRSQSDAVRFVVINAAKEIGEDINQKARKLSSLTDALREN